MPLETVIKYPSVFLAGLLIALVVTPLWRRVAVRLKLLDVPGGRKIHRQTIPLGGGVAVFLGFHAACAVVFLLPWKPFAGQIEIRWWLHFIPLSCGVLLLGLMDDRFGMKPMLKLAGQTALALAAYALNIRIQNVMGMNLPEWADFVGTILWFLAIMNAFNLIDGVDGLACGIALIASCGIGISLLFRSSPGDVLLFAGFCGACLGFLRYNYYPASVFLGDTGSLFLGFTLAALTISTSSKGPAVAAIGVPMLAVGVPLFDTILAVWRRAIRRLLAKDSGGEAVEIDQADADHLHHRLLRQGRKHNQVAWLLYLATAFLALTGILTTAFNDKTIGILGIAFVVTAYTVVRHLSWIELRETGEVVMRGISRPVRRNLSLLFYILIDLIILNAAWVISMLLVDLQDGSLGIQLKSEWLRSAPVDVLLPFLILMAFRSYSRAWSLAGVVEYAALGIAGLLGAVLVCAIDLLRLPSSANLWNVLTQKLLLFGLAVPCILGVRGFFRIVQELMHRPAHVLLGDPQNHLRTLVAGDGPDLMLYFHRRINTNISELDVVIDGVISSDSALRGHYICGFRVLGNLDDIPAVIHKKNIHRLVWVGKISAEQQDMLRRDLKGMDVQLNHWQITEQSLEFAQS